MNTTHHELLARIATMYYNDGHSQDAIGAALGLSRVKIYRLLKEARATRVAQVLIQWPLERVTDLEQALVTRFQLRDALVLKQRAGAGDQLQQVGQLGAQYVERALRDGCTLAICLGRSTYEVVNAIRPRHQSGIRVAQALGSNPFSMQAFDSATIAQHLAQKLGGEVLFLSAPMLADTPESAAVIRRQPQVQATLQAAHSADVALVGIGTADPAQSRLVEAGFLSADEMRALAADGVVGDMAGQLIRADGSLHPTAHNQRGVGITLAELAELPLSMAVAADPAKAQAVRGALRTRAVNVLCTDEETAAAVLRLEN